jgi:putative transport protein
MGVIVIPFLQQQPVLTLFLTISIGYILGQIKIKGFSLESSAILFVALFAGHIGLSVPPLFKTLGLLLFIYAIGLQAGPTFFKFFKKDGLLLNMMAIFIVTVGAIVTFVLTILFHLNPKIAIGLFAGALTSTPGLAAAQEATGSSLTSIGYGIAYPFGVIGVILFVNLLPVVFKKTYDDAEKEELSEQMNEDTPLEYQHYLVQNPAIFGKSLKELHFRAVTNCVISRIMRGSDILVPKGDTQLQRGDLVRVVGRAVDLSKALNLLGAVSSKEIPQESLDVRHYVVTNKKIIGKKIKELSINSFFRANITRIRRGGIEIPAMPYQKIEWGDRLTVVGEKNALDELRQFFGNDIKALEEGNIYSIILGMVIGILLGMLPVSFGHFISIKMGISGGILVAGLLLSNLGKTGPIIWRAPGPIVSFIREMGLIFFLSAVGTDAGSKFVDILVQHGLILLLSGGLITIFPMILTLLLNKYIINLSILKCSGLIAGGMTSTPGLASISANSKSSIPMMTYASVYPIAMIFMIIWCKILALLF